MSMELPTLIDRLSRPTAYPFPVETVTVKQTHISVVFLAEDFVYKIKKPVDLGFLDFTTLDRRRHFCEEETRLNRRLAAEVYLGVVPVTQDGDDLRFEGGGEVVEWAVKMSRLPDAATLRDHLVHDRLDHAEIIELAKRIAAFHRDAAGGAEIAKFGQFDLVAANARENFAQSRVQIGPIVSPEMFARLEARNEAALTRLRLLIEERAAARVPRDTHGDLRLDHVYHFPDRPAPADWAIIDCIEFNERYRYADPVADMAFLVMDLIASGRPDLAKAFSAAYFQQTGDSTGTELLPFSVAYRAAVRAKVEGMTAAETEVPNADRHAARRRAGMYWNIALGQLEEPCDRPALLLIGGLPGTGKSTLARGLAEQAGFEVIRSDVVRKELGGWLGITDLYSAEFTQKTFGECQRRARRLLRDGLRVIVDATFRGEARRREFLGLAEECGVPGMLFLCEAEPALVRERLAQRVGDASDADWEVYQLLADKWEPLTSASRRQSRQIDTTMAESATHTALNHLRDAGLFHS